LGVAWSTDLLVTTTETMSTTWRKRLASALPSLLGFLYGLVWFHGKNPIELVAYSAGLGFLLYVGGLLAYFVAVYFVASLSGETTEIPPKDSRLTATLLLFVVVWILGTHWVNRKVDTIVRCVQDPSAQSAFIGRPAMAELIRWCAEEYGADRSVEIE
jgi:hypothetical protein